MYLNIKLQGETLVLNSGKYGIQKTI